MSWFDSAGNQVGSYQPDGLWGTHDWDYVWCETPIAMPDSVAQVWVCLCAPSGSTGNAWFDDVSVLMLDDTVFGPRLLCPNYRNTILPNMPKTATIAFDYTAGTAIQNISKTITVSVVDTAGTRDAWVSMTPQDKAAEQPRLRLSLSKLQPGAYSVSCTLANKTTGQIITSAVLPLVIANPTDPVPTVYIDSQNRCIVNGTPFFPRGFYNSQNTSTPAALANIKSMGLNTNLRLLVQLLQPQTNADYHSGASGRRSNVDSRTRADNAGHHQPCKLYRRHCRNQWCRWNGRYAVLYSRRMQRLTRTACLVHK